MKKFASILALSAILLSSFLFPAHAEEEMTGGWFANVENPTDISQEVLDAFDAAMEGLVGCTYKPVALLGSQVVAGMNYCLLCEKTVIVPDAQPSYALVYLYDGINGERQILKIEDIEFNAFDEQN